MIVVEEKMAPKTVIYIEDEPYAREPLAKLIRIWGYDCLEYDSAVDFLNEDNLAGPALYICDLNLQDMRALEFCDELKRQNALRPFIITSGFIDQGAIEYVAKHEVAFPTSPITIMQKPLKLPEFRDTIQRMLGDS